MWFVYAMLANVLWSFTDVLMSMIVHRVHKDPIVLGFFLGCADLLLLAVLAVYQLPALGHLPLLLLGSVFAYLGMLSFFTVLSYVDVSVSSAAWVFMSIGIALGGVVLFGEAWSALQSIGAILSVCGVLILTFWHKHISTMRTCVILAVPGFMFVPHFLINEYVLLSELSAYTVFFWNILFYGLFAVIAPILIPRHRKSIHQLSAKAHLPFCLLILFRAVITMVATYTVVLAYDTGYASLVGIAENGQPFFLMFFAWLATLFFPKYAPKELLTTQSIAVKVVSFIVVFTGLSLLVI